jgi:hypothetical protein
VPQILRTASRSKTVRKTARKTGGKVAKKVAKTRPVKRSLILIGAAVGAVAAAFVAKKALGGGGDQAPDRTDSNVERADATWSPTSVPTPASKESASAGPNGDTKTNDAGPSSDSATSEVTGSGSDASTTEPESVPAKEDAEDSA